ncbi:RTA1-domain-containing protein [Penicillium canescens]|uniref:RTA1-domain-containing protein n=1 Tax=Penicillium canescens TaxID=5083 RepID=A0AAD6I2F0_PENCN|nr:RTA1-domain-containing protein [Penicillium canescens]KAJ6009544.1 RTA1-domain-containing protein [Penicillium canescens]KAJ6026955.1 RTA1-domain-containing protein [Penicillium canescens]KAJ6040239.1 RTA1-domain-containing protein [Penicillium canescens]KAJ6067406.1 RTA1-domain-containing protein [Penicillium canescens]
MLKSQQLLQAGCQSLIQGVPTPYSYQPSLAAGIVFSILFCFLTVAHIAQSTHGRRWWSLVFAVGCFIELLGWVARTWSAVCPYNLNAFLMQISTLIMAPVFFAAGLYILFGVFISIPGCHSSYLSPISYFWIFILGDCTSLLLQGIGGGLASSEMARINGDLSQGTHIMLAGIILQIVWMTGFICCVVHFLAGVIFSASSSTFAKTPIVPLLRAMVVSVICIYIRCIYRTAELLQGWSGYLITHEVYFISLDAGMMLLAALAFNIVHPSALCELPTIGLH